MPTLQDIQTWRGQTAVGPDGEKVGTLDHVYVDRQTGEPTFAAVKTGLFGSKVSLVPVEGARHHEDHVHLAFDKARIKDAPNVDDDGELSEAEEQELYAYYGQTHSAYDGPDHEALAGYGTAAHGRGAGHDTSGPNTDDAMTRSEEELRVGKTQQETGRARLRKYVVTEQVEKTIPVQREEVRIEREPITDANAGQALDGPAISSEEHEVTLHAETPVVSKEAVPKERVRMEKDVVTEDVTVTEELRKERIDAEGDTGTGRV